MKVCEILTSDGKKIYTDKTGRIMTGAWTVYEQNEKFTVYFVKFHPTTEFNSDPGCKTVGIIDINPNNMIGTKKVYYG